MVIMSDFGSDGPSSNLDSVSLHEMSEILGRANLLLSSVGNMAKPRSTVVNMGDSGFSPRDGDIP